jgi:hypothetical protein
MRKPSSRKCPSCRSDFNVSKRKQFHCSEACRFCERVLFADADECWTWQGARHGKGYGHFKMGKLIAKAHRTAYELFWGPIPDGMQVLHTCDNPPCVNPKHLFLGTNNDNLQDRQRKGRQAKGERHGWAILTEKDVIAIRSAKGRSVELAKKYGVAPETIASVRKWRSWKYLASPAPSP